MENRALENLDVNVMHEYVFNAFLFKYVYWLMRIARSETICINKYENWEASLIIALYLSFI